MEKKNKTQHEIVPVEFAGNKYDMLIMQAPRVNCLPDGKVMVVAAALVDSTKVKPGQPQQAIDSTSSTFRFEGETYPVTDDYLSVLSIVMYKMGVQLK